MRFNPRAPPPLRACAVLVLAACNQLVAADTGGGTDIPPDVVAAFERSCGLSPACHAGGGESPALDASISGLIIGAMDD